MEEGQPLEKHLHEPHTPQQAATTLQLPRVPKQNRSCTEFRSQDFEYTDSAGPVYEVYDDEDDTWRKALLYKHKSEGYPVLWFPSTGAGTYEGLGGGYSLSADGNELQDSDGERVECRRLCAVEYRHKQTTTWCGSHSRKSQRAVVAISRYFHQDGNQYIRLANKV
jgi:hypothetical protein